jgi:hypothetical protein
MANPVTGRKNSGFRFSAPRNSLGLQSRRQKMAAQYGALYLKMNQIQAHQI